MKRIFKNFMLIAVMIMLCMAVAVTAGAADSGDFTYEVVGGEATITGYTGSGGVVTVPEEIDGYPVTAIGDAAFCTVGFEEEMAPAYKITSLTLPETVKRIGEGTFLRVNLTGYVRFMAKLYGRADYKEVFDISIYVPSSVETIGPDAFTCMEFKGTREDYPGMKINIYYGGDSESWAAIYGEENIIRTEQTVESVGIGNTKVNYVQYTDKNTVEYNCEGVPEVSEQPEKESDIFSVITDFLNKFLDFFRKLFGAA